MHSKHIKRQYQMDDILYLAYKVTVLTSQDRKEKWIINVHSE